MSLIWEGNIKGLFQWLKLTVSKSVVGEHDILKFL